MLNVRNGWFRICGEIVVVLLINGGPSPFFLDESVYRMLVDIQVVDILKLGLSKTSLIVPAKLNCQILNIKVG